MKENKFASRNGVEIPFIGFGNVVVRRYIRKPSLFIKSRICFVLGAIKRFNFDDAYNDLKQNVFMSNVIDDTISEGYTLFDIRYKNIDIDKYRID